MKLLPVLFFVSILSFGQEVSIENQKKDSIFYYIENAKDSLKVSYLKKATILSQRIKHDSLLIESSIKLGLASFFKQDTIMIKESNSNLAFLYKKSKDSLLLAKIYHFKGLIFRLQNRLDSSYYYYNKSKDVSLVLNDSLEVGRRLLSMGLMQNDEKDYRGGQTTAVEALRFLEPLNENKYTGNTYNLLGNILTNINQFEESRDYFGKALDKFKLRKNKKDIEKGEVSILNNIGYSYYVEKKFDKALRYLEKGLSYPNVEERHASIYKWLLGNAASCKYELGRREEAWKDLNDLLKLREEENNDYMLSRTHNNFANYYILEGKNKKALYHAKKTYDLSKKGNNNFMTQNSLKNLSLLTSGKESKAYIKEYIDLGERLYKRETELKEQFALVRYETEKKEKENAGLKLENTKKQAELDAQELQKVISWLVSVAFLLVLILSLNFFRNRRKKLMYEAQLQKASAREEERQQIAKSLHDEVAGDLRMLHRKLSKTDLLSEAKSVEKIKDNVRNLSHQLSSVSFDEVSFKDQIINLVADNFSLDFRIKTEGIDTVLWETVNSTIKRTLYLSIRESLQNTLKYAEANKFFIRFATEKKEILLLLEDNGKGFDLKKGKKGIGLKNLKERVEEIQGSFDIKTSEQGTKTTISIPINGR